LTSRFFGLYYWCAAPPGRGFKIDRRESGVAAKPKEARRMKKKIGTVMEDSLLYGVKKAALEDDEPLSRVLERAVNEFLEKRKRTSGGAGIVRGTFGMIKLKAGKIDEVMDEPGFFEA
jgi:hypothetical protein